MTKAAALVACWVVLGVLSACGGTTVGSVGGSPSPSRAPPSPSSDRQAGINGGLDCTNDRQFQQHGTLAEGTEGAATPEEALKELLGGYADDAQGAEVVFIWKTTASVVVGEREVVTASAWKDDYGWFVTDATGCDDGWRD